MQIKDRAMFILAILNFAVALLPPFNGWSMGNLLMGAVCLFISTKE